MRILLYCVSLLWLVAGAALIFAPELMRKLIDQVSKIKNLKLLSIAPVVVALILLFGASSTTFPIFPQVLAVLAVLKALVSLLFNKEKIAGVFTWWLGAPELAYRLWGLLAGGLGLILFKIII